MYALPSLHPAFVLRGNARWRGVLQHDFTRAIALSNGWRPKWTDDNFIYNPTLDEIRTFLRESKGKRVSYDVETDGRHPMVCDLRCLGMFNGKRAICIPFLYRDGTTETFIPPGKKKPKVKRRWVEYYPAATRQGIVKELNKFVESARTDGTSLITQNGQYDRLVMRHRGGVDFHQGEDNILGHHVVASFLPHSLGFQTSMYTDRPYYKATEDGEAWSSTTDEELHRYCMRDCVVTWIAWDRIRLELAHAPQYPSIYEHDKWQERSCERMKEVGVAVDVAKRDEYRVFYSTRADTALRELRDVVRGMPGGGAQIEELMALLEPDFTEEIADLINPGSLPQLRACLHAVGIPLTAQTDTGLLSTAKEFLLEARKSIIDSGAKADDRRIGFLDYLFAWRENSKVLGTFLNPEILPDGRIHPTYSVHVTPTGRLASKRPNFQNQPKRIRGMYVARPGHSLVCGDWDSLELRLTGLLSGERTLIDAFNAFDAGKGPKIHKVNCANIFGLKVEDVVEGSPKYRAAKVFVYAVNYGATANTVYEQVRKDMPDMQFGVFNQCYDNFKKALPRMFDWQKDLVASGMRNCYLETFLLKRREYFFERAFGDDSPEASAMLNFPLQGGGADIVSTANRRICEELLPKFQKKLRKGESLEQILQVHDELGFEVPDRLLAEFEPAVKKMSEVPPRGTKWNLPVKYEATKRWGGEEKKA